jgi:phospholipid/cholesterol/gamma-HCH transport system permease protein
MSAIAADHIDVSVPGTLRLRGEWTLPGAAALERELSRDLGRVERVEVAAIERLDSAGVVVILRLLDRLGIDPATLDWREEHRALARTVGRAFAVEPHPLRRDYGVKAMAERVGRAVHEVWRQGRMLLGFLGLVLSTLAGVLLRPARLRLTATVHHMEQVGLDAVPLTALLSFMIGAVVAFLGITVLRDFGAEVFVVELVGFAFLREFGVLLTAILLAGRTSSAFTAQIGAMKAREEIDAIRTLGLDPIELLVIPRLLALLVMLPLLSFLATLAGIAGGLVICLLEMGMSPEAFVVRLHETIQLRHFVTGLSKAPVFAFVIALIGCLEGFKVGGTAQSVGERTTSSVVQSISLVILLDAVAAVFFMEMGW